MVEKEYEQRQSQVETSLLKYILKENVLYRLNYVPWIQREAERESGQRSHVVNIVTAKEGRESKRSMWWIFVYI